MVSTLLFHPKILNPFRTDHHRMKIPIHFTRLALIVALAIPAWAAETAARPNIVFIISDDQAWSDYSFMGHPKIATPRLDQLAAESLTFHRGYTPVPVCRPSLATMITGLYPHQHGVTGNDPDLPDKDVNTQAARGNPKYAPIYQAIVDGFAAHPNLVRDLTQQDYVALQTGKWWEGDPIKTAGFTHAMTAGTGKGDRHGGKGLEIGREGLQPIRDFVEQAGGKPFIVWYAPFLPHDPHTPPADLLEKYQKLTPSKAVAAYWGNVEWFDRTCGELLDYLDEKKLRDNTIVIYVCDNGWIQDPDKPNRFAPRSKLTPYEGGVRTPIMVSWPGKIEPRMEKVHLASSADLWPTLAALLKTKAPDSLPGINLTDPAATAKRTAIFGEQYAHNIADVKNPTKSMQNLWIIEGWWKLILPNSENRPNRKTQLYNLSEDPWEKNDLSDSEPDKVKDLSAKIQQWWKPAVN
jgi:arylsulfatase A-like enzyme